MIIVDTAIAKRIEQGNPIKVALFGAGFSARHIASQIISSFPAIHLAIIVNRTLSHAKAVYELAGVNEVQSISQASELETAVQRGRFCISDDPSTVFEAENIDAVIEATGEVEYGAFVAMSSIKASKHIFVANCEVDATVGPLLKHYADKQGVIYSNSDGDEPGVARNLSRHVAAMGLEVVGAGNLKGFYDPHRTPETQQAFATANNQKPNMVTSFVDGTKLSMELTVTANALGFQVAKRGMHGIACNDVRDCLKHFPEGTFQPGRGIVDYLVGAAPYTGAFVIGHTEHPMKRDYLRYLKMGDGPLYVFYTPFHLPQLEIPITVARGVLMNDAAVTPKDKPYCDAIAMAKCNLKVGDELDGIGGFKSYAMIENFNTSLSNRLLPMGVSANCRIVRDVARDTPITYDDVVLPSNRPIDALRNEMINTLCLE
jgi:predicted homoserine dehydrogenase-like protein